MIVEKFNKQNIFDKKKTAKATEELIEETIYDNPYVYLKPYKRQLWPLFELTSPNQYNEPHSILVGGGGYGGKTILGSIAAAQYLQIPDYQCLITRKNRKELIGPNSIWRNLSHWLTRPELGKLRLDPLKDINKTDLMMKAPSGATLWFKYFDEEDSKQKVKSESYDRIINDEASELKRKVLQFHFRSLRNAVDSFLPLAMINFSNPGGPSTEYLADTYVKEGSVNNYYLMDWRHNPFINQNLYSKTLDKLDVVDIKYQKDGDWFYRPAKGELFREEKLNEITIPATYIYEGKEVPWSYGKQFIRCVRGIDMAITKTGDYSAFVKWLQDSRGHKYIVDVVRLQTEYPEETLLELIALDNPEWHKYKFNAEYIFERQPADSGIHQERFFQNDPTFSKYLDYGLFYDYVRSTLNKFTRARPLARAIKNNEVSLVNQPNSFGKEWVTPFIEELKDFGPDYKEYDYDDQTDAASIGFNKLGGTESLKIYM
jgi:predicted phage terminase large subunit-like protein